MAIGAACNDIKDAQNLMLPMMLPLMLPMMLLPVVQSPSSALSVGMSMFPPATPLVMLLRVALHPTAPTWQVALAAGLTLATTAICIWAAGRMFRVGLLMQGKSASLAQMVRWISSRRSEGRGSSPARTSYFARRRSTRATYAVCASARGSPFFRPPTRRTSRGP